MNAIKQAITAASPLAHTALRATITDLLCEYELRHGFRNEGKQAIEAVYSFPIPLDAAFMGMDATLAGDARSAQVLPARQASRDYDQAIGEGDTAVLLEQLHPGLLCVNLGNLKPGESGEIVLRFAAALNVADGVARFSLPLVHRPRYGRSRLDDVAQPRNDFAVEHPLEAEIRVQGLLAACPVQCATQGVRFALEAGDLVLRVGNAMLDRDLVLNFDLGDASLAHARRIADGEGSLGVATFTVPHSLANPATTLDLCLLLDGSGSMQGDAIVQSRAALAAVTDALREQDRIQVIRFGSSTRALFRRPLQASARVKDALRELKATVDADLGGTEMDAALQEALRALGKLYGEPNRKVIILVTDGAVNAHGVEHARQQAMRQGVRVFVVAVGSSAGVDALSPLAESTRATLERAVPAEPIDAGVMRQLRRARSHPATLDVAWTGTEATPIPPGIVYPGDAVTLVARFADQQPITASARLVDVERTLEFSFGELQMSPAWRAWAGQRAYLDAAPGSPEREALALRYGLITDETKAVLVKHRAEHDKVEGLPTVVPVAHMVPAGMIVQDCRTQGYANLAKSVPAPASMQYLAIPAFMRRQVDAEPARKSQKRNRPTLDPAAKTALALALRDLALHGEKEELTLDELLQRIDGQWHQAVRDYCRYHGLERFGRHTAATQLLALLTEGVAIEIDDDEEACLAALNGGAAMVPVEPIQF